MKKFLQNAFSVILALYWMSLFVMTPYYNWQYAKENGFIKWVFLGEFVATFKSMAWPVYMFLPEHRPQKTYSQDERHYLYSKKASDEAILIAVNNGDVTRLTPEEKTNSADLLELAVAEANQVQLSYLQKMHPELPDLYENKYKRAINQLIIGLRTDNKIQLLAGAYTYNEFSEWLKAHNKDISY